ncbi:hypothetical protein JCM8097_008138 [Rhodosporidiobolus ruineniae]
MATPPSPSSLLPASASSTALPGLSERPLPLPPEHSPLGTDSLEDVLDCTSGDKDESAETGGGGNETDVEDEDGSASGGVQLSDEQVQLQSGPDALQGGRGDAMYPFPLDEEHVQAARMHRRGSSAIVEASSADDSSADDTSDVEMSGIEGDGAGGGAAGGRRSRRRRDKGVLPRLRRLGALGISVHSDDDQDAPDVSGLGSSDLRPAAGGDSSDTRATDLGISISQLRAASSSAEDALELSKKRRKPVADATFRGVVDDLVVQNLELKSRLRRYEAGGVPNDLKKDRLFEIRFGPAMPMEKRLELESYLQGYVQDLAHLSDDDEPLLKPSLRPPPPAPRPRSTALPSLQPEAAGLHRFALVEPNWAGPSNSGIEPVSLSGTGSAMLLPPICGAPLPSVLGPQRRSIDSAADQKMAHDVVAALEHLFIHSLLRTYAAGTPAATELSPPLSSSASRFPSGDDTLLRSPPSEQSPSNEAYFSQLLSHDFLRLSRGYVYLNLACTMAQTHRFSVTLAFVQQAVRQFSTYLEISEDGGMIRWVGPRSPDKLRKELGDSALMDKDLEEDEKSDKLSELGRRKAPPKQASQPGATTTTSSKSDQSLRRLLSGSSRPPSGTATTGSSSSSSRDPSSGEGTALNGRSLAAPSTAATSQPSSGQGGSNAPDGEGGKDAKPPRPTAAVLQPMDRLRGGSVKSEEAKVKPAPVEGAEGAGAVPSASTVTAVRGSAQNTVASHETGQIPSPRGKSLRPSFHRRNALLGRLSSDKASSIASAMLSDMDALKAKAAGAERSGTVVFYANTHFCSDLSKEAEAGLGAHLATGALPTLPDDEEVVLGGEKAFLRRASQDGSGSAESSGREGMSLDSTEDGLIVENGRTPSLEEAGDGGSGSGRDSGSSSLARLRVSGMTSTTPADLFTLVVHTRHSVKRALPTPADSPIEEEDEMRLDEEAPSKKALPASYRPPLKKRRTAVEILSTRTIYHSPSTMQRDPFELAFLSMSGSGSSSGKLTTLELSEDEQREPVAQHFQLTSHNLAALAASSSHQFLPLPKPSPNLPSTPSPPHDDYPLSLSAPSHDWAPREPGLHSRSDSLAGPLAGGNGRGKVSMLGFDQMRQQQAAQQQHQHQRGKVASGMASGASATGFTTTTTGDERPISLSDSVGRTRSELGQGHGGGYYRRW